MGEYLGRAIVILFAALALEACATTSKAINVSVSQMQPYPAARGPGCDLPVLTDRPKRDFEELAIVEGWAGSQAQEQELLQKLKDRACQTGADALLITYSKGQKANPQNSIEVTDQVAEDATKTVGETVLQEQHDKFNAIRNTRGMLGTPGHGGFYVDSMAIKFKPHRSNP